MGRKEDERAGWKVLPNSLADLRRDTKIMATPLWGIDPYSFENIFTLTE